MRLIALFLLAACNPTPKPGDDTGPIGEDTEADADTDADTDTDSDTDADTDTDTEPDCTASLSTIAPADGELDVALDAPVVATFSEAVTAADIAVGGVAGTVTLADDGSFATFVPDAPLSYGTTYEVTTTVCGAPSSSSFTTVGEELEVDLTDRTYDIELDGADVTWVSPSFGSLFASQLVTNSILFMVQSADTSQIDLVGAAGYEFRGATAQYPCTYAVDFEPAPFTSRPFFSVGPLDAEMEADGVAFDIFDMTIDGTMSDDASEVTSVLLTGSLDTRPLTDSLGLDICALATDFGEPCVNCPDGEPYCLAVVLEDESAPWREGLWIDKDQDPSTDRYCE